MLRADSVKTGHVDLSLVIPVYNGSATIRRLVDEVHEVLSGVDFEVVLVNDGSRDFSEEACRLLVESYPDTVRYVHLARKFGEDNAVLAGLRQTSGRFVAVLDGDGQNLPREVLRMYDHAWRHDLDVVYGRYQRRQHSGLRRLGNWLIERTANFVLDKPQGAFIPRISSFKVMSRFVVDEVVRYRGPFPCIDGLILRTTCNIGEIAVDHCPRRDGRSGYAFLKLISLWLKMFLGFSVAPLRLALVVGAAASGVGLLMAGAVEIIGLGAPVTINMPTVLVGFILFFGVQLTMLGLFGEYLKRQFLEQVAAPQYVVRYIRRGDLGQRLPAETRIRSRPARAFAIPLAGSANLESN